MSLKKNWFYYLCMAIAIIGLLYILVCGFMSLGAGQEYPYLPKGMLLIGILIMWMVISFSTSVLAKVRMSNRIRINPKVIKNVEILFVLLILVLATGIRILAILKLPMQPASDYKTYYEIALLLKDGTIQKEGKGYCNYIAMFPHVMGYCYVLKTLFSIVGTSVLAGQYLNVFFSVATVFFTYKIARKIGGRTASLVSIVLCAFWPSQILYITMLSAEYCFTFMLYLCVWLFVSLVKDYDKDTKNAGLGILGHFALGICIALTAAIRPMALILLVAIILTIFPQKMKLQLVHKNNIPLTLRMLEKGWIRCILIIIPYMIISNVITTDIELTVDKTLPSASTSFGYNLLVGLNTQSVGGWNDEDAALLYASMEQTGSATQAHITCRDLAFQRIVNDPKGICNLFIQKYELLWGNDDYGATWNIAFLDEQGNLTQERSDFLYSIRDINDIFYMIVVFLALVALIYLLKREGNVVYVLVLLYIGTVVMHLFVESQNRYHYFVLEVFMILAGLGVEFIYRDAKSGIINKGKQKSIMLQEKEQEQQVIEEYNNSESKIEELRIEAYSNVFDMKAAIESGSVIMTVSKAYMEEEAVRQWDEVLEKVAVDEVIKEQGNEVVANEVEVNEVVEIEAYAEEIKVKDEYEEVLELEVKEEDTEVLEKEGKEEDTEVLEEETKAESKDIFDKEASFENKSFVEREVAITDQKEDEAIEHEAWNEVMKEQLKANAIKLAMIEMKMDAEIRVHESKMMIQREESAREIHSAKEMHSETWNRKSRTEVTKKKRNHNRVLISKNVLGANIVIYKKPKKKK